MSNHVSSEGIGRTLRMQVGGAGRGAAQGLPRWKEFVDASPYSNLTLDLIDPAPGKALMRVTEAMGLGITARPRETTVQRAMEEDGESDVPILISIDDPEAICEACLLAAQNKRAIVINVFIQLPSGKLMAMRCVFAANDRDGKVAAAAFFATLGRITLHAGSVAIWGAEAPPANILLQPAMRDWFVVSVDRAYRLAAGLRCTGASVEVTFDGVTTIPMAIRDSRGGWADAATLANEFLERPPFTISRGTDFLVAEVANDAMNLVTCRLRRVDGEVRVNANEPVNVAEYIDAMRRAEQARLTALNPVRVTD